MLYKGDTLQETLTEKCVRSSFFVVLKRQTVIVSPTMGTKPRMDPVYASASRTELPQKPLVSFFSSFFLSPFFALPNALELLCVVHISETATVRSTADLLTIRKDSLVDILQQWPEVMSELTDDAQRIFREIEVRAATITIMMQYYKRRFENWVKHDMHRARHNR